MFLVSRRLNHCSATNQKVTFWPKETGIRYGDTISGKAIFTSGRLFCLLLFSARELVWWPHGGFLFHLLYYYIERSWTFGRRGQCFQLFTHFDIFFVKSIRMVKSQSWFDEIFTWHEKKYLQLFLSKLETLYRRFLPSSPVSPSYTFLGF